MQPIQLRPMNKGQSLILAKPAEKPFLFCALRVVSVAYQRLLMYFWLFKIEIVFILL